MFIEPESEKGLKLQRSETICFANKHPALLWSYRLFLLT
jgi:hypothetical protein